MRNTKNRAIPVWDILRIWIPDLKNSSSDFNWLSEREMPTISARWAWGDVHES
jgi:hypothetical protein